MKNKKKEKVRFIIGSLEFIHLDQYNPNNIKNEKNNGYLYFSDPS